MSITLPKYDKRTAIVGSTGSGKTQFAVWLLSTQDFDIRPWVIFDFKGDALIDEIGAVEVNLTSPPPTKPGIYIVRPLPGDDKLVSEYFKKIWAQEEIGIYIDEGYMIPKMCRWFRACLTQGRSKHIPMIVLSQRPVWMDKYVFTEANYFAVFKLNNREDRKHMKSFLDGREPDLLPKYHCLWYDVDEQQAARLAPVPDRETLISSFQNRLENRRVKI